MRTESPGIIWLRSSVRFARLRALSVYTRHDKLVDRSRAETMVPVNMMEDPVPVNEDIRSRLRKRGTDFETVERRRQIAKKLNDNRMKRKLKRQAENVQVKKVKKVKAKMAKRPRHDLFIDLPLYETQPPRQMRPPVNEELRRQKEFTIRSLQSQQKHFEKTLKIPRWIINLYYKEDTKDYMTIETMDSLNRITRRLEQRLGDKDKLLDFWFHRIFYRCCAELKVREADIDIDEFMGWMKEKASCTLFKLAVRNMAHGVRSRIIRVVRSNVRNVPT